MRHPHSPRTARSRALVPITAAAVAVLLAGCSTSRFGGGDLVGTQPPPANLPAAPQGSVQSGQLPPAVASGPGNIQPLAPSQQPGQAGVPGDPTQTAALDPAAQTPAAPAASALPVTENSLVGNWTAQAGGGSCSAFFGLTNLGSGLLGGTRGCSGTLTNFRTWQVAGNRATLKDSSGNTVATLSRTGDKTFSGQTATGEAVTLTR